MRKKFKYFIILLAPIIIGNFTVYSQQDSAIYFENTLKYIISDNDKMIMDIEAELEVMRDSVRKNDPQTFRKVFTDKMDINQVMELRNDTKKKTKNKQSDHNYSSLYFIITILFICQKIQSKIID
ncbi:MAG TPA: hypothetical protein VIY47_04105 [Ignavibacteriaceae bacterium]